ncbi:beta-defensin 109-like [Psammomys obesus]|uniref:beta-defensin 109-like n=1 Tax=Psammomys obesus TaxID=48139 RepID=UPI002452E093|nr:beta-defensin 109-like [Psammomys obesus]
MRLYLLLYTLLFLLTLLPPVRSGLAAADMTCVGLEGICRRDVCKLIEDEIGGCRRRWKCCRPWWILLPIPTPVIFSDYQDPIKSKMK